MMTDKTALRTVMGGSPLGVNMVCDPTAMSIWVPTVQELAMLKVQGSLYGNQVKACIDAGVTDYSQLPLPCAQLRGALGHAADAAAVVPGMAPAVVPAGAAIGLGPPGGLPGGAGALGGLPIFAPVAPIGPAVLPPPVLGEAQAGQGLGFRI